MHKRGDRLRYSSLTQAIEQTLNDVKADPYQLVFNLLKLFFKGEEHVPYEKFQGFFGAFVSYFEEGDIRVFLREVTYIKRGSDQVYFQEVASMIRDDIEQFPK